MIQQQANPLASEPSARGRRVPVPASRLESRPARSTRLVVVEGGAHRFDAYVAPDGLEQTVVVAQLEGECIGELVTRIRRAIEAIERSGRRLEQSIVVAAPQRDSTSTAQRLLIGRALLARSESGTSGMSELFFMADRGDPADIVELMTLIEALVSESGGDRVPIRLRFVEPEPASTNERPSGVFRRLLPLDASPNQRSAG